MRTHRSEGRLGGRTAESAETAGTAALTSTPGDRRARWDAAAGNRALQRLVLPVQRASVDIVKGKAADVDVKVIAELQAILDAAEARRGRPRVGVALTRLETLLGVPISRDPDADADAAAVGGPPAAMAATPAPAPVPSITTTTTPLPMAAPALLELSESEDEAGEAGEEGGPTKRLRTTPPGPAEEARFLPPGPEPLVEAKVEEMVEEKPAEEPAPKPKAKSKGKGKAKTKDAPKGRGRGTSRPPGPKGGSSRKRGREAKTNMDTTGLSAAYNQLDDGSEIEQLYIEGPDAFVAKMMETAAGAATPPEGVGKRFTGWHSEMKHVTAHSNVRAVAASQAACLLCYGFLERLGIEHGPVKERPFWTPMWTHGPMRFDLRKPGETTTNPNLRLSADPWGSKVYQLQDRGGRGDEAGEKEEKGTDEL